MTVTQLLPISARKREAEKAKRRDPKASAEILRAFFFFKLVWLFYFYCTLNSLQQDFKGCI